MEEKRKHPRARVYWDVTVWKVSVEDEAGTQWEGETVDLSPGGVKVRFAGTLEPGTPVTLIFAPPDGGPIISARASVVRRDARGHAFAFAALSYADYVRLRKMVKART
ncbi:MAG: PilZ domain-containing protein [Candidatus Rokubacteria bacterium]|nr:PilZ domain-containing protein [Candidatus Rokubacteria bacterium]